MFACACFNVLAEQKTAEPVILIKKIIWVILEKKNNCF